MKYKAVLTDRFINPFYLSRVAYEKNIKKTETLLARLELPFLKETVYDEDMKQDSAQSRKPFLTLLYDVSEGFDAVVLVHADSSYYSFEENSRLLTQFHKYDADYGFAEDYPAGVVFEMIRREALPVMENIRIEKGIKESRFVFEEITAVDVNMFDLENLYAPVNLRVLRLSFFCDSEQNRTLIQKINKLHDSRRYPEDIDFRDLGALILDRRDILTCPPAYIQIEFLTKNSAPVFYSYVSGGKRPLPERIMPENKARELFARIKSSYPDAVLGFAGEGEFFEHPGAFEILTDALSAGLRVIVESSLVPLDQEGADRLIGLAQKFSDLTLVILCDACEKSLYKALRPDVKDPVKVLDLIEYILLRMKNSTYMQITKIDKTLEHLVPYYNYYQKYTDRIIIAKYNTFCGKLPERRLNPMEPFDRIDCWHLKRDLYINADLKAVVCGQDLFAEHVLGDVLENSLEQIVSQRQDYLKKHISGWAFCGECDEYYTYNF